MKIDFGVYCLGYSVGGRDYPFEIEIDDNELEGMSEDEKLEYIHKYCYEYIMSDIEICLDFDLD